MKNLLIIICLLSVVGGAYAQTPKPIVLGQSYEMKSVVLSETRTLNIYLPPEYGNDDTTRYPVIYLLDGGVDEDFIHIVGLVQFSSFPWIGWVPNSIVVGVVNVDKRRDMAFPTSVKGDKKKWPTTGGSAKFMSFLGKELQPYIDKKFRTNKMTTLIGESMSGLLATEILCTQPQLFTNYIIVSPSLWWDNGTILKRSFAALKTINKPMQIYIGVGKEGLAPSEEPRVMEVDANLLQDKIDSQENKYVHNYLDYLPDENHATIEHHAVLNAFRRIYIAPAKQ